MLELIFVVLFCWIFFKAVALALKFAWGGAKIVASVLLAIAVPLLVIATVFIGGLALLIPVALIALALGLLKKACP